MTNVPDSADPDNFADLIAAYIAGIKANPVGYALLVVLFLLLVAVEAWG